MSELKDALPSIAAQRKTEPARLPRLLRGELDWIVMKALDKDRTRRYETASDFAQDIQRYLADDPVEACPPAASYRIGKVRTQTSHCDGDDRRVRDALGSRGRDQYLAGDPGSSRRVPRHRRERKGPACRSRGQGGRLSFFADRVLAAARPAGQAGGLGKDVTVRKAVDAAEPKIAEAFPNQPTDEAAVRFVLGNTYNYLGEPLLAVRQLEAH